MKIYISAYYIILAMYVQNRIIYRTSHILPACKLNNLYIERNRLCDSKYELQGVYQGYISERNI